MGESLDTYVARARRYLREVDATTSFWNSAFFTQLFNSSYRRRCAQLIMAYEGWFVLSATRDLEADKATYGNPPDLQRLLKLELVRSDSSRVPLQRWERHDEVNPAPGSALGGDDYFPNFRPLSDGFTLEPTPVETVTNGLRIEYNGLPAALSGGSDQIHSSFPAIFDELLVLDTVCAALQAEGLHELGPALSIFTLRKEYEWDFERFIESRTVHRDEIDPFIPHWIDA